ncbi:protein of unknown function [Nitrospira defluvii]|uniref:Uncharacterized protein n=1 Tax=Nitrospira defluvii TaxID=330214 RepID=D8PEJ1_9BACT|nr:protein of unknown function [Nitrospira defluvii]
MAGDELIARTETSAAAAVGKGDDASRVRRETQDSIERDAIVGDSDLENALRFHRLMWIQSVYDPRGRAT